MILRLAVFASPKARPPGIIAAMVTTLGISAAAAMRIVGKFDGFAMLPASALSGDNASMVDKTSALSSRNTEHRHCIFLCIRPLFFFWVQLAAASSFQLFKADDDVIIAGIEYMWAFSFDFLMASFVFCINGFQCLWQHHVLYGQRMLSTLFVRIPLVSLLGNLLYYTVCSESGLAAPLASLLSSLWGCAISIRKIERFYFVTLSISDEFYSMSFFFRIKPAISIHTTLSKKGNHQS